MTTYYVDTAVGNDANAGTSEGAGNAWATIQKALDTVAADDHVYIKATGNYAGGNLLKTAGGTSTTICFEGYTSTPGDGGKITIDATGSTYGVSENTVTTSAHYMFRNIKIINATSHGWYFPGCDINMYQNCEANNNGGNGWLVDRTCYFSGCRAKGNTLVGFFMDISSAVYKCEAGNNGSQQFDIGSSLGCVGNLAYGADGSHALFNSGGGLCLQNTFDGEGQANIDAYENGGASILYIMDNIFHDVGSGTGYCCNLSGTLYGTAMIDNNLFSSVTNKYDVTRTPGTPNDIDAAAGFSDEANDDYTLDAASAAVGAGIPVGGT